MELEDVTTLATRAMESVLAFVRTDGDFSAITKYKERDVTRRFDLVAEQSLQDELFERGVSARIVSEAVSYTHLRAHETDSYLVCRLLLEKKKKKNKLTKTNIKKKE